MPNTLTLPVIPGTLAQGFCPSSLQELLNGFDAASTVTFPNTFSGISVSTSKPTDTSQAWLQLDSLGRPIRLYFFAAGAWLSLHPQVPGMTQLWINALPDFTTFDGGDSNAPSAISGPTWQVAVDLSGNPITGRFPIAVGALPTPSTTVLAVGAVGGEELHVLTDPESSVGRSHQHAVARLNATKFQIALPTGGNATPMPGQAIGGSGDVTPAAQSDYSVFGTTTLQSDIVSFTGTPPVVTGHNNLPPYIAMYFLQRTSRLFYAVN